MSPGGESFIHGILEARCCPLNALTILKPILGRMPLYYRLMYMVMADPAVRKRHKALLSAGLLYAISPIDLVPGIIPVIGQMDDIIVALSTLLKVLKRIPAGHRGDLLSNAGLRLETLESDLEAAKSVALFLATRPIAYVGHAATWTGKRAVGLISGIAKLGRRRR
jgi:uncharacterized membrane protein YkvA (DUF1232 family)